MASVKNPSVLVLLVICSILSMTIIEESFGLSSFSRQEITDGHDDWTVVKAHPGTSFPIVTPSGARNAELGQNETDCKRAQHDDYMANYFHPPDILSVTYLSNGKTLNATLWLSSAFTEPPSNASDWLSLPRPAHIPWYMITYGMSLASHSIYDTEGTDYAVGYAWDVLNNTWTRTVSELSPQGDYKTLELQPNYNVFPLNAQRFINLSLDLSALNYPEQYDLIFYAFDYFIQDYRICPMNDLTARVYVPPPEFILSSSPSSLELRPGEQKTIKVQLESNADIKSIVLFSTNQTEELKDNIEANFSSNIISVPLNGIVISKLDISALEKAEPGSYTLPIFSGVNITTEAKPRRSIFTGEIISNPMPQNFSESSSLTVTILPSLTIPEYINSILNTWGAPLKELVGLVTAIGAAGGVIYGVTIWIKKRKQIQSEPRHQNDIQPY